ncbi:MAG: glycosylase [Verrucomicrobia bacterium]|nr:glycosylase [Verrucomicrobiota bacterium]
MVKRLFNRSLLRPGDVPASQADLQVIGVFNPAAVATASGVALLVRVAEVPHERRPGRLALPRWDAAAGRVVADWVDDAEVELLDARVVRLRRTGWLRLTSVSHLCVLRSRDGRSVEAIEPGRFLPASGDEEFGVEDPRLTPLDGRFYFTYVAVSRHGAATALASTTDFKSFERHGIIFPAENKDVVLFPERVAGRYVALHRPNPAQHFSAPEMWLAESADLIHWGSHRPLVGSQGAWDVGRVGAGTPPVRTARGWLEIYHGNNQRPGEAGVGAYAAGALLLDLENPGRVLAACGPVLAPETNYERGGFVPNVVFPTGIVPRGETALVYYGAADSVAAVVEVRLEELLEGLRGWVSG